MKRATHLSSATTQTEVASAVTDVAAVAINNVETSTGGRLFAELIAVSTLERSAAERVGVICVATVCQQTARSDRGEGKQDREQACELHLGRFRISSGTWLHRFQYSEYSGKDGSQSAESEGEETFGRI